MSAKTMFKKAAIASAVVGALSATSAHAVNLADDGLGEAFVIPYFSAANGFNTYLNITNTSAETTAVKIRFREGFNSREVRDFNIVLSPYDVWTGAVVADDTTGGGKLITADTTCTVPAVIGTSGSILFTTAEFDGATSDKQDSGPDGFARTLEGYVEIFNMGRDGNPTGSSNSFTPLSFYAEHVDTADGRVPRDCSMVEKQFSPVAIVAPDEVISGDPTDETYLTRLQRYIDEPTNTLKVSASLLDVADGTGYAIDAITLANFFNPGALFVDGVSQSDLIQEPGNDKPDFASVSPVISEVHDNVAGTSNWISTWATAPNSVSAVDAVLMRKTVINQYRYAAGNADTDWVVTFPTKHHHVDYLAHADLDVTELNEREPFANWFHTNGGNVEDDASEHEDGNGKAPSRVGISTFDREEDSFQAPDVCQDPFTGETFPTGAGGLCPSPTIPLSEVFQNLDWEVNVIEFGEGVFGSQLTSESLTPSALNAANFEAGWTRLTLGEDPSTVANPVTNTITSDEGHVYTGLPVVGASFLRLDNGTAGIEMLRYGFSWEHGYTRAISGVTIN